MNNQMFHERCFKNMMNHAYPGRSDGNCTQCHVPPEAKGFFKYLGNDDEDAVTDICQQPSMSTTHESTEDSHDITGSAIVLVMTAEQLSEYANSHTGLTPTDYFRRQGVELSDAPDPTHKHQQVHLKVPPGIEETKLSGGKLSILVDLGSQINVIGSKTEKHFAAVMRANKHQITYEARTTRLKLHGIGSRGSEPTCVNQAIIPIAMKSEGHGSTPEVFKANIADGSGKNMPAILGSESMQEKNAVLLLKQGKEIIAFPGPGGYKITWSEGTHLIPMVHAPSGHLVIQCDGKEESASDSQENMMILVTDHTTPTGPKANKCGKGYGTGMKQSKIDEANTGHAITEPVQAETQMPQASSSSTDPMPDKTDMWYVTPQTTTRGMRTPGSDEEVSPLPGKGKDKGHRHPPMPPTPWGQPRSNQPAGKRDGEAPEGEVQGNSNSTSQVAVSAKLDANPTFALSTRPSVNFRMTRGKNKRAAKSKKSDNKGMERINALNLEPSRKDL
jgi:hypothetical protein